jgi:thiamine monophosphate synthase
MRKFKLVKKDEMVEEIEKALKDSDFVRNFIEKGKNGLDEDLYEDSVDMVKFITQNNIASVVNEHVEYYN